MHSFTLFLYKSNGIVIGNTLNYRYKLIERIDRTSIHSPIGYSYTLMTLLVHQTISHTIGFILPYGHRFVREFLLFQL